MDKSFIYWFLIMLWILSLVGAWYWSWPLWSSGLFLLALFVLIGLALFGKPVK